ncbi:MAG: MFS transporter [Planctomycetia bacterium]|nr:MFS transporter [Planctomycetia bacterium]
MKYYRWELLLLLSLAFFFHQADRALFGILLDPIQADLQLTSEQMGLTGTVLFAVLAFLMPVAGYVGDRFNKKWVITCSILFWSMSTLVTGWARSFWTLMMFRSVATAGGESFYAPAAYPMLAAYHKTTRSIAFAVHQGALYIGVMSSGFLAGWIAKNIGGWVATNGEAWLNLHCAWMGPWWAETLAYHFSGWRVAFAIYGILGILLGLIFIFRLKGMPKEENSETPAKEKTPKQPFGKMILFMLTTPTVLLLTVGFTAIVFVNNAYLIWAPAFLGEKFQLDLTMAGWNSMFYHHIAAFVGILAGGTITDLFVKRFVSFRIVLQVISLLLGAPAIFMVGASGSLAATCAAFAVFGLFRGLYETNTHAAMFDVVPPEIRSSAVAFMTFIAFLVGSLGPMVLGILAEHYGKSTGLSYGFQFLGVVYFIGFFAVLVALLFTFKRDRITE